MPADQRISDHWINPTINPQINMTNHDRHDKECIADLEIDEIDPDETTPVNANIPAREKAALKAKYGHGAITKAIEDGIDLHLADNFDAERLRLLREQKREIQTERAEKRAEIQRIDDREALIDAKIADAEAACERNQEAYQKKLDELEEHVRSGGHIFDEFPGVKAAAEYGAMTPEAVMETVRERIETKHEIVVPDHAFEPRYENPYQDWHGINGSTLESVSRSGGAGR